MTYEQEQQPESVVVSYRAPVPPAPRIFFTPLLIAINLAVFALMVVKGVGFIDPNIDSLLHWGANYGPLTTHGQWWRMLTAVFVHIGVIHVLMNMYILWIIGSVTERLLGKLDFVILYLLAGVGGSLASLAWHPFTVSAGASGAVFGLFGLLLAFVLRHRGAIPKETVASLTKFGLSFIAYNLIWGLMNPKIDMAAHLGGLVTGFVFGLPLARPMVPQTRSSRWKLSLVVSAVGAVLAVVCFMRVPPYDDVFSEVQRFAPVESKLMALYNDSLDKAQAGQLTEVALAQIIEQKLLPPWNNELAVLSKLRLSAQQATLAKRVIDYFTLRGEAWSLYSKAFRSGDATLGNEATEKWRQANDVLSKSNSNKTADAP